MSTVVIKRPVRPCTAFSREHAVVVPQPARSEALPSLQLKVIKPARHLPVGGTPQRLPQRTPPAASYPRTLRGIRRLVALTLASLVVLGAIVLSLPSRAQAGDAVVSVSNVATKVVVKPGESLWDIAVSVAPERDTRDVVLEIMKINELSGTTVHSGQHLEIPVTNR